MTGLTRAAASIALVAVAATTSHAQLLYQWGYGSTGTDASRGGVLSLSNDDVVIVGETNSHFPGDYNVYLIKTDGCDEAIWGRHYDLGGNDYAHKIRETSDGGFIIVGETENTGNCCVRNDIFLLKVDAVGAVQWAHTYGGNGEELGRDVQVVDDGYIVAGASSSFGQGSHDAYLMKTDANGDLLWARVYGGDDVDIFMSCAVAGNTNIIATGATRSFTVDGSSDLWLTRVFQTNGLPIMPGFPVTYGGEDDDIGWSVVECGNGDIAVAGGTVLNPGYGEGYLLRTGATLLPIRDRTIGGANNNPGNWDEFTELKELSNGNFIVTGFFLDPTGGFGDWDMYVAEVDVNFTLVSSIVHGGAEADQGFSIVEANSPADPYYLIAGLTASFTSSMDMYLVRQRPDGTSACFTRFIETVVTTPRYPAVSVLPTSGLVNAYCDVTARRRDEWVEYLICSDCGGGGRNMLDPGMGEPNADPNVEAPALGMNGWNDRGVTVVSTPAVISNR
jgi:hypothetical protein